MEIKIRINDKLVRGVKKIFSRRVLPFVLAVVLLGVTVSLMAQSFVIPFVFKSGEVISSSQMNANFTDIADSINALMSAVDGLSEGGGSLWVSSGTDYYVLGKEVGIGLTAPASLLHAYTTKAIGQGEDAGITVESAIADNPPFLGLGIPTKPLVKIWRNPADDSLKFDTGGATRMTLASNGDLSAARLVDSNNSNYHVDPASTSHLNGLETWGYITSGESGSTGRINVKDSAGEVRVQLSGASNNNSFINGWNFGIRTNSPSAPLCVGATISDGSWALANEWSTRSDIRFKENLVELDQALEKLGGVGGYYYNWKNGADKTRQIGVVAQEIEQVFPELVSTGTDGYKAVDYGRLTAVLIQAVKELKAENDLLKERMAILEAR
jgi:hypothetical protein